jgi:hypothetical protein
MSAALPQSVTEKSITWIILHVAERRRRVEQADAKMRRLVAIRTRLVCARDATRGCRGRLVLRETAGLEFRGG